MKKLLFFLLGAFCAVTFGVEVELSAKKAADFTPGLEDQADGSLRMTAGKYYTSQKQLPIDPAKSYSFSGEFKLDKGGSPVTLIFSAAQYTEGGRRIAGSQICVVPETETELAAPAEKGATSIKVKDTSKWVRNPSILSTYRIAFNVDPSGKQGDLPNLEVYAGLGKFTSGDGFTEIELKIPLKKAYPQGTPVRLHIDRWFFGTAKFIKLTEEWQKVEIKVNQAQELPLKKPIHATWWPGAAKVGFLVVPWPPNKFPKDTAVLMRNLEMTEQ
ncbi:MAG: hypothetical protein PHV59_01165 [Victivallales bacterium]|nr:hypothetical protein [Victivallales bacterium]